MEIVGLQILGQQRSVEFEKGRASDFGFPIA